MDIDKIAEAWVERWRLDLNDLEREQKWTP